MAKQGRVGMSLWDRLVLLVAWVMTCGLVYVLGIYVGKAAHDRRPGGDDRVVRLPVASAPPAEGQRPKGENELRFYETLMSNTASEPSRADGKAAAPSTKPAAAPPAAPASAKPAVATTPPASKPVPVSTPTLPTAAPRPAAKPPLDTARTGSTGRPPLDGPPVAASPRTSVPPPSTAPAEARTPGLARAGGWTVQANPTRDREEAETLLRQLHGRGYDASIVRVLRDGDTWYRIQVGHFATSDQATEIMQKLREREGVSHAFVASE